MSTTTKEIMEYLKGFPEDSKFGILAVNVDEQKKYAINDGELLTIFSHPTMVLEIGEVQELHEEEKEFATMGKRPEVIWEDEKIVRFLCKNCGEMGVLGRSFFENGGRQNYCAGCGMKFNWERSRRENEPEKHEKK